MKTIVENSTQLSKYLLEDSISVALNESNITVADPAQFIISDLNNATATLHTSVSNAPEDWEGNRYTFDGTDWTEVV